MAPKRRRLAGGIILDPPPRLPGKRRKDPQAWHLLVSSLRRCLSRVAGCWRCSIVRGGSSAVGGAGDRNSQRKALSSSPSGEPRAATTFTSRTRTRRLRVSAASSGGSDRLSGQTADERFCVAPRRRPPCPPMVGQTRIMLGMALSACVATPIPRARPLGRGRRALTSTARCGPLATAQAQSQSHGACAPLGEGICALRQPVRIRGLPGWRVLSSA